MSKNGPSSPWAAVQAASKRYTPNISKTALAAAARDESGATIKACQEAAATVIQVRRSGKMVAWTTSRGHRKQKSTPSRDHAAHVEPITPIADRLRAFRKRAVCRAWDQAGFRDPSCGDSFRIELVAPADAVNLCRATRHTGEGWVDYKSKGHKRGIVSCDTTFVVPLDWRVSVQHRGLAVVDGLLTLFAMPVPCDRNGVEVYRARWVRQGRGVSLEMDGGFLLRHTATGTTYHALNCEGQARAVAALLRKVSIQATPPEVKAERRSAAAERAARRAEQDRQTVLALIERVRTRADSIGDLAPVVVTLADSRRAGNCREGTEAFRDRHFPDHDTVTLGEIVAVVGRSKVDPGLARQIAAAALVAIRRERRSLAAVLA